MRTLNYGDQEAFGEAEIGPDRRRCRAVPGAIVGGKKFRPDLGELCVSVLSDDGKSLLLLRPDEAAPEPLTDAGWAAVSARIETELSAVDDTTRRAAAASQDGFWASRHQAAARWVAEHPAPPVPAAKDGAKMHPIDAFLAARIEQAVAASAMIDAGQAELFDQTVQPIFAEQCVRCHGEKHTRATSCSTSRRGRALRAGRPAQPAVVPGDPAKSEMIARLHAPGPRGCGCRPRGTAWQRRSRSRRSRSWIKSGCSPWPEAPVSPQEVAMPPVIDDAAFLRRTYLDTVGVLPTEAEARAFLSDASADKRVRLIPTACWPTRVLQINGWATGRMCWRRTPAHARSELNNSEAVPLVPLYDALRDGKPMDRLVTELIAMRGGKYEGGSAGFAMAADNDAPLAAKGQVLGGAPCSAWNCSCARCHDSPFHSTKQRDLYSLAAMLDRKAVTVPKTSTVPAAFFEH